MAMHAGQLISENKPDPDEILQLPEGDEHLHGGERRIYYEPELRQDNTGTFTIWLEDHTAAHALRSELLRNRQVKFAGYKVPHPLENKLLMRVQVTSQTTPVEAMKEALKSLRSKGDQLEKEFDRSLKAYQGIAGAGAATVGAGGARMGF
ncbi:DNA-directed RNA polymerase II, putative [Perkinsus marinus ATCC 50983]|uniref:DNA-directed RNA polymerase II, putative n=1 Tax=Perkinsus marinus (strain ATCC 50983 / TXsc) TaxID=423536 RepID=C5LKR8_PERM5|nr:DNA-directed RNA polymerase II, putative [Perkinsus marinus ATCC 50983]EER02672.1 DNA-directed RNA polymerase II, putative [Perkinsus marinus ATCC 50983]|eukprot:XP_002769975.1 DNA-directed RNA polymerase II, putative [Perkinsus marinus ATCC 50983]